MATNSLDFLLNLRANTTGFDQGINGSKFAVNALVGAMAALGVGLGVKELVEAADSYAMLSAKIQQSTKESGNFQQAIAGVHQIALNTNSSLDATAGLFTKLNTVAKDMGQTQQYALDMTSTVTKAIQLGGGSAQASEAAVQQFIQAMQGGVLRGEEFNSIMENGYGLAEALAKGLGVTTGELRKMAETGELSAERVLGALAKQKTAVDTQYAELPLTIGNALQKIATKWQILIGQMDQANGASATVAQWLSTIADNLVVVEKILNDIGDGFVWFGDQLKKIDVATIEALKTALLSAYDAIKSLGSSIGTTFETSVEVLNEALGQVFKFSSGIDSAKDKTNGFTKALQYLNVAFGFLSDGFKAINIGMHLIIGGAYDAAAAFSYWKSKITFGEVSAQAQRDFEKLSIEAQKHYKISADEANKFESAGLKAINQISLTQDEKNTESVANNLKKLNELTAQEQKHVADYKAISDERIKLHQQLVDARKSGDQGAIDAAVAGLAELDKKEKAYQAESEKITKAKIAAAQAVADATIKTADAAGQAALKALNAQLAVQGLKAEFNSAGKVIISAMEDSSAAVQSLDSRVTAGRKGAAALGVDIDVALNKVSEGFKGKGKSLDDFSKSLELMGATGKQAADLTYEAWQKWADQAKSPAEIDAAKAKLVEFEKQGVFSAKQVEMGMRYLDEVNGKLPANISEVEKAYKLLGITSREEANKMADSQVKAFNVMQQSGTASAQQVRQALINMADKIYASGDAAKIAWYESKLGASNLQSTVDETGKASVKLMDELNESVDRIGRTARGSAADGFRDLGRVAREEAKTTAQEWEDAMAKVKSERDAQNQANGKGLAELQGGIDQMAEDYFKRLVSAGMDAGRARDLANKAKSSLAQETATAMKGGTTQNLNTTKQEMEKTLAYWENGKGKSSVSTGNYQPIQVPTIQAPTIEPLKMPNVDTSPAKNVRLELAIGESTTELYGTQDQVDATEELFRQLEQAKKRM